MAFQLFINGLVQSSTIALMSLGMTLIFGLMRIVNFAHGEFYMFGAVIVYYLMSLSGLGYIEASIASVAIVFLMGWVVNKAVFRRFHGKLLEGCIAAIALSIGFQSVTWLIYGARQRVIPSLVTGQVEIFGASVTLQRLLIIGVALAATLLLTWIINRTKFGKSLRAVQQDSEAALILGISVDRVTGFTFALATALAALSSILVAPLFSITPVMGNVPLNFAFIVIIVGGMGSMVGALITSFIIGFQHSLTSVFLGPQYAMGVSFALAIVVLIFRPRGLMGNE